MILEIKNASIWRLKCRGLAFMKLTLGGGNPKDQSACKLPMVTVH